VVKSGDNVYSEAVHFVDSNFLEVFNFPLAGGSADLTARNHVLITERMAEKYFGRQDPVGQSLLFYAGEPFQKSLKVAGVLKDLPSASSIRFTFLTHLDNQYDGDQPVDYAGWRWLVDAAFLKLRDPADASAVEAALQAYVAPQNDGRKEWQVGAYRLESMVGMADRARDLRWNNLSTGISPASVWGQFILASLILLTACFNFANMTISISDRRLKEMGVRKTIGGTRRALMAQLLTETAAVCLLGVGMGILMAFPLLDWYNRLHEFTGLQIDFRRNPALFGVLAGTFAITTLLAGAYPAFYLASFKASGIFRGTPKYKGAVGLSRLMLGLQTAIALLAVIMGVAFAQNAEFNRTADLGYDRESLIAVPVDDAATFTRLRDACRENPDILATAGSNGHFGFSFRTKEVDVQGQRNEVAVFDIGENYLSTVGLTMASGQAFQDQAQGEAQQTLLVNELFVRELCGGRNPIGQTVRVDTLTYRVAGVVNSFYADGFFDNVAPALLRWTPPENYRYLIVKARPEDLNRIQDWLRATWKRLEPYQPYAGAYQNEVLAESLQVSANVAKMGGLFALISLLLTVSGLFALTSLNILKRSKEIAIRRVLGAGARHLAWLLNRNYLWFLLAGAFLGALGGRIFALALLNSIFKTHAGVGWGTLLYSVLLLLLVAGLTISIKLMQALKTNPAQTLKAE
jgi:putative ABC transport system permease protein